VEGQGRPTERTWCLVGDALPDLADAIAWATTPGTGAVVTFTGAVRDHAPGYHGVTAITYEVFEAEASRRLAAVAAAAQSTWPELHRVALWHRSGLVPLGGASVQVVVGSAHRGPAFRGAQFCIDVLKACLPVWKLEHSNGGSGWGMEGVAARSVDEAVATWLDEQRLS
jgi:molybdopterin synthase catalytic subunit